MSSSVLASIYGKARIHRAEALVDSDEFAEGKEDLQVGPRSSTIGGQRASRVPSRHGARRRQTGAGSRSGSPTPPSLFEPVVEVFQTRTPAQLAPSQRPGPRHVRPSLMKELAGEEVGEADATLDGQVDRQWEEMKKRGVKPEDDAAFRYSFHNRRAMLKAPGPLPQEEEGGVVTSIARERLNKEDQEYLEEQWEIMQANPEVRDIIARKLRRNVESRPLNWNDRDVQLFIDAGLDVDSAAQRQKDSDQLAALCKDSISMTDPSQAKRRFRELLSAQELASSSDLPLPELERDQILAIRHWLLQGENRDICLTARNVVKQLNLVL